MSSSEGSSLDNPGVMEVTGRVLIGTIIALVVVLVLVFLFHIYANCLWHRRQQAILNRRPQDHHHHHHPTGVTVLRRGLDAAFLNTLPVFLFDPKHFKDGLECSVCLSELEAGEKTRTLPKCNHVFHAECIDMWFHSHSTCPICRNPVADQTQLSVQTLLENHQSIQVQPIHNRDSHTFPTNVFFWGDETQVSTLTSQLVEATNNNQTPATLPFEQPSSSSSSSSSECTNNDRLKPDLVIDIPRHAAEEEEEEEEGEQTPIMRSLRRILSSSTRFNPFSPRNNVSQQGQS